MRTNDGKVVSVEIIESEKEEEEEVVVEKEDKK